MNKTLILATTHRGLTDDTYECMLATGCQQILKVKGMASIDRARCTAFDRALGAFQEADSFGLHLDVLLCIDDDMIFMPTDAQRLVDLARASGHPTSARYVSRSGQLLARQLTEDETRAMGALHATPKWLVGLGFLAIPRAALERVAARLPHASELRKWCLTGDTLPTAFPGEWVSEDFFFCAHFGGVDLAPIDVGHLKTVALYPGSNGGSPRILLPERRQ